MNASGAISIAARSNSLRDLVVAHQVVERIVERPQIRIDFLRQVAGQKSQALAGFDRGAHQHDALDRVALERVDGAGDREIGLAGSRRSDAERDVVFADVAEGTAPGAACGRAGRGAASCSTSVSSRRRSPRLGAGLDQPELHVLERQIVARPAGRNAAALRRRAAPGSAGPVIAEAARRGARCSRRARSRSGAGFRRARRTDWRAAGCRPG